jgi:hypothetical protein
LMVGCVYILVIFTSRITGFIATYLVRWWWVIAALLCVSVAWSAYTLFARSGATRVLAAVGFGLVAVLAVVASWQAAPAPLPLEPVSVALEHLSPSVAPHLNHKQRYLVSFVDSRDLGAIGAGLYLDLTRRGYDVKVPGVYGHGFGSWRVADAGAVDGSVTVAASDDVEKGWTPPSNATPIASYDPLRASARERATRLVSTILRSLDGSVTYEPVMVDTKLGRSKLLGAGADPDDLAQLAALRRAGSAYTVYLVRPSS